MVHTVGIVGVNGNVGGRTSRLLIEAARQGKIKLVLFYREENRVKSICTGYNVETRFLNFDDKAESIELAIRGINVFM